MTGEVRGFVSRSLPPGWLVCDGRTLPVARHQALFAVIGGSFGGDGVVTFALPDLLRNAPVHPNADPARGPRLALGQVHGSEAPPPASAPIVYAIAAGATDRRRAVAEAGEPVLLGEVRLFAGAVLPRGWLACDGQVLRHGNRPRLAALLDDAYGGDGRTTFCLPDLRAHGATRDALPGPLGERRLRHPLGRVAASALVPCLAISHMIALDGELPC